jgi:hypothetical protein
VSRVRIVAEFWCLNCVRMSFFEDPSECKFFAFPSHTWICHQAFRISKCDQRLNCLHVKHTYSHPRHHHLSYLQTFTHPFFRKFKNELPESVQRQKLVRHDNKNSGVFIVMRRTNPLVAEKKPNFENFCSVIRRKSASSTSVS